MNGDDCNLFADQKNEVDRDDDTNCTDGAFDTDIVRNVDNRKVAKCPDISNGSTTRLERASKSLCLRGLQVLNGQLG